MPGVPPDAVENVKKLFKGIFRRGKNKKQSKPDESAATTQTTQTTSTAASQQKPAVADSAPNTDKPLPPTHPLETGPHDKPQEAVPQNHEVRPELGTDGAQETKKESASAAVSPASVTQGAPSSGPVSAIEKDTPPALPPKDGEAVTATAPASSEPLKAPEATAKENAAPVAPAAAAAEQPAVPAASTPAPTQTIGTTDSAVKTEPAAARVTADAVGTTKTAAEEKVAVQEDTTAAQKQPSGGMSATSGPLEDYPLGFGDKE